MSFGKTILNEHCGVYKISMSESVINKITYFMTKKLQNWKRLLKPKIEKNNVR